VKMVVYPVQYGAYRRKGVQDKKKFIFFQKKYCKAAKSDAKLSNAMENQTTISETYQQNTVGAVLLDAVAVWCRMASPNHLFFEGAV